MGKQDIVNTVLAAAVIYLAVYDGGTKTVERGKIGFDGGPRHEETVNRVQIDEADFRRVVGDGSRGSFESEVLAADDEIVVVIPASELMSH